MAAVLDRVPVDRINAKAEDIHLGRSMLALLAGLLFLVGWMIAKTVRVFGRCIRWAAAAFMVGWEDARADRPGGG